MSDDENERLEQLLRARLAEQARRAPQPEFLAERIIAVAGQDAHSAGRRRWQGWALPAVAAAAVVGVVVGLIVSAHPGRHDDSANPHLPVVSASPSSPAPTHSPSVSPSSSATNVPVGPPQLSTPPPTPSGPTTPGTSVPTNPGVVVPGFHAIDLTFVSDDEGFALGSAPCLNGDGKTCSAIVRTTDGGQSWYGVSDPADVPAISPNGCQSRCIEHLRFATTDVGYAFGPGSFFRTTDGGQHWSREPGGAIAVETLDGTVLRAGFGACSPPGCPVSVQSAALGSVDWTTVTPAGLPSADSVQLSRNGTHAYLLLGQNPAGGASSAHSALYTSNDNGRSWVARGEPCPQLSTAASGEVDANALTTALDGSVTVLCWPRAQPGSTGFTATSVNGGASFVRGAGTLGGVTVVGAASSRVVFAASDALYRSVDGGGHWQRVAVDSTTGNAAFLGFESASTGRWITGDGSQVWTTTDGGATWTTNSFG